MGSTHMLNILINETLNERFKAYCERRALTITEACTIAIQRYLDKHDIKKS